MIYFLLQCTDTATGYKAITVLTGYRQWLCAIDNGVIIRAYQCFALLQGCGRQRGHANAATIAIAVLIGASGTSAANAPLLKQGKFRDGSTCPALSEMFRSTSCFFLFGGHILESYIKLRKYFGICKCGVNYSNERKKDTGYPSRCPTTKSTIKIKFMTAIRMQS